MKPSNRTKRRAETLARKRSETIEILHTLTDVRLLELLRRDEETAEVDGYGSGASDGGRSSDISRPTETAALSTYVARDEVHLVVEQVCAEMSELHGLARRMGRSVEALFNAGDKMRGRVSSLGGMCQACGREVAGTDADRLRSGYCHADYARWLRAGRPDRPAFERATPAHDAERVTA